MVEPLLLPQQADAIPLCDIALPPEKIVLSVVGQPDGEFVDGSR